ncbi:ABC transporter permease [Candidatus Acetothermia bacterium]|nr:ABC transporter permease [Candidatus Acetothermia bacterium]MBI3642931.1 ABC transporter permease [Candidatus Acetothermia bacterium]
MKGFLQLTWMEVKLFIREWQAVFFTFIFLPMLLFLFGLVSKNDPSMDLKGFGSVDIMLPGFIAIGIAANAFFTIGGVLASYRERGILRRFQVTPLRPLGVLAAQVLVAYAMTLLSGIILMLLGKVSFGLRIAGDPLTMLVAFTIGSLSFFSFGFLLGGLFKTARVSYSVNTTIFFPMIFLSGAALPVAMPSFMEGASKFIPLTYVVNLLKDAWLGRGLEVSWPNILFLVIFCGICVVLSAKAFRWD